MLNNEVMDFNDGRGYIEGDSGVSFPRSYTWVQCKAFRDGTSVMTSIALIPLGRLDFTGGIAAI